MFKGQEGGERGCAEGVQQARLRGEGKGHLQGLVIVQFLLFLNSILIRLAVLDERRFKIFQNRTTMG